MGKSKFQKGPHFIEKLDNTPFQLLITALIVTLPVLFRSQKISCLIVV